MNQRNSLATQTPAQKRAAYAQDVAAGAVAYYPDLTTKPLASLNIDMVEFIGGVWRVQIPFERDIIDVRGKPFVLLERLPHMEKNRFEYWRASMVYDLAYGRKMGGEYVVAMYRTNRGVFSSYGSTIEQARAFLGIRLYDEFADEIHKIATAKMR